MTKAKVQDEAVEAEMEKIYQSVGDISGKNEGSDMESQYR